jgi:phosphatidyl-myo-inositol alpha-mannosyltransferase
VRVGLVCPYSLDVPGGVQFHVRDLAERLLELGHEVSVLAPADDETPVPDYVESAGRTVAVPYNGSVARVAFGPVTATRVRRWLAEGHFDVLHLHEPVTPSLSLLALWAARGPIVATFHSANLRSRAMQAAYPLLRPSLEKISARIAVSEDARRTLVDHLGGDAVLVPNGVYVDRFAHAPPQPRWQGTPSAPTIAFVGRLDEPRKGLPVLVEAVPQVLAEVPGARFLVAGRGDADAARERLGRHAASVELLGPVTEEDKAGLLRSSTVYVAPHTGGESFGIVLVEAMSAGTAVLASDLPAFSRVLDGDRCGRSFPVGQPAALARGLVSLLRDERTRAELERSASARVRRYDWGVVAADVLAVYETVVLGADAVGEDPRAGGLLARWRP